MRTPLTFAEVERYVSNDRLTISVRRDDLTELREDLADLVGDSPSGLERYDRLLEVLDVALRY